MAGRINPERVVTIAGIPSEALIDALTFWVTGYRNVTASYGVNGFTDEHLAACQRHGLQLYAISSPNNRRKTCLANRKNSILARWRNWKRDWHRMNKNASNCNCGGLL